MDFNGEEEEVVSKKEVSNQLNLNSKKNKEKYIIRYECSNIKELYVLDRKEYDLDIITTLY